MRCPYCRDTGKIETDNLGGKMLAYRARHRIGVREAARRAGVSFAVWARVERGDGNFSPANAWVVRQLVTNRKVLKVE